MTAAAGGGGAGSAVAGGVGRAGGDYRPSDFALAIGTATLVLVGAALVLRGGMGQGSSGERDTMLEVPVRIVGLPDPNAPLLKLGGGPGGAKGRPRPPGAAPKAPGKGAAAPPPPGEVASKPRAPGEPEPGPTAEPREPSAPDTGSAQEPAAGAGTEAGGAADAGAAGTGLGGPPGEGHPEGVPGGTETDPLKARAADVYRARLIAWFSSRFRVTGSGLPQAELLRLRAPATVTISGDRRVLGYSLSSSGNAAFDAAARRALEGAVGATLPPPPENYPDLVHGQLSVTFVCTEGRCD